MPKTEIKVEEFCDDCQVEVLEIDYINTNANDILVGFKCPECKKELISKYEFAGRYPV